MTLVQQPLSDLLGGAPPVAISGMTLNSRQVAPGDLYVALSGSRCHGLDFTDEAIERGCAAVLWERDGQRSDPDLPVPAVGVTDLSGQVSALAGRFYGRPSADLTVIAVTGTNGKSSCVEFIAQALKIQGHVAGTIGTLGSGLLGESLRPVGLTTPDPITVQRELARLRDAGASHVAMEVSSHGLDQDRIAGVDVAVAVVTNISRDHLDYHGTMTRYRAAKARLLTEFSPLAAIVNADDDAFAMLRESLRDMTQLISFSAGPDHNGAADIHAGGVVLSATGCHFQLQLAGGNAPVTSSLMGRFNIANLLAVAGVMAALDPALTAQQLADLLARLAPPAGRMQRVSRDGQPLVVVDYAHTPDALEKALAAVRSHSNGQLTCVFGCGGDRDQGKRPLMGAAAGAGADRLIVTSDNPRSESPNHIIRQIMAGVPAGSNVTAIADRRQAIARAVHDAAPADAVLVAGKGHEDYQEIDGKRLPFDDCQVAREVLEACA